MRNILSRPGFWIALGTVLPVIGLFDTDNQRSHLWFTEFLLYILLAVLLWRGGPRWRPAPPLAILTAAGLSWTFGMIYETSLTVDGSGIGGVDPDTLRSFVLAQGDYLPLALLSVALVRWRRMEFRQMVFVALGISLTEGLIFAPVLREVLLSPAFALAPLFLAYYTLAYATFIALPFLIVAPEAVHRPGARPALSVPASVLLGFVAGLGVRLFWGLVYSPVALRALE